MEILWRLLAWRHYTFAQSRVPGRMFDEDLRHLFTLARRVPPASIVLSRSDESGLWLVREWAEYFGSDFCKV